MVKIGYRKPSIKKSIKAHTTGKAKRAVKKTVIPGYGQKGTGVFKNPKKAAYNRIYNRTTRSITKDLGLDGSGSKKSDDNPRSQSISQSSAPLEENWMQEAMKMSPAAPPIREKGEFKNITKKGVSADSPGSVFYYGTFRGEPTVIEMEEGPDDYLFTFRDSLYFEPERKGATKVRYSYIRPKEEIAAEAREESGAALIGCLAVIIAVILLFIFVF